MTWWFSDGSVSRSPIEMPRISFPQAVVLVSRTDIHWGLLMASRNRWGSVGQRRSLTGRNGARKKLDYWETASILIQTMTDSTTCQNLSVIVIHVNFRSRNHLCIVRSNKWGSWSIENLLSNDENTNSNSFRVFDPFSRHRTAIAVCISSVHILFCWWTWFVHESSRRKSFLFVTVFKCSDVQRPLSNWNSFEIYKDELWFFPDNWHQLLHISPIVNVWLINESCGL
jgi:hypothetical protein